MRKKWTPKDIITPEVLKSREKRKWQLALRRYVLEKIPSTFYAPYFGLDIVKLREWFELQFTGELQWGNFAVLWQIEHIIPAACFDLTNEQDLRLCWNFTNLKAEKAGNTAPDILGARAYFQKLYTASGYSVCQLMLDKIATLEKAMLTASVLKAGFLVENEQFLSKTAHYTATEFQQLNNGRSLQEIEEEQLFLKKFK